jgi:hypothetical protein
VNPVLGTLADLDGFRANFDAMTPVKWAAEFLGIWPSESQSSFLDLAKWSALAETGDIPSLADLPSRGFSIAVAAHRDQLAGSIAVCWYEDATPHVLLYKNSKGISWLASEAAALAVKYGVTLTTNSQAGANKLVADEFAVMQGGERPRTAALLWSQIAVGDELLVQALNSGNLVHYAQPQLDEAVPLVTKYVTASTKFWGFTTADRDQDITSIEAVAMALYAAKNAPKRNPLPF